MISARIQASQDPSSAVNLASGLPPHLFCVASTCGKLTERYRKKAEECRAKADNADNPTDQSAWRHLARDWINLAEWIERIRRLTRRVKAARFSVVDHEKAKSDARTYL